MVVDELHRRGKRRGIEFTFEASCIAIKTGRRIRCVIRTKKKTTTILFRSISEFDPQITSPL
ncbi:hypothetical protein F2Q69_00049716 [Brassica cretica]|uniref:Uncharacterized protein n=1 Tax=Brassica cretica TaxID=69181 RepID=A0A8S9PR60_BRACR|nr:hypothetical protein F2Q69_00049716 [Brassica cretica]